MPIDILGDSGQLALPAVGITITNASKTPITYRITTFAAGIGDRRILGVEYLDTVGTQPRIYVLDPIVIDDCRPFTLKLDYRIEYGQSARRFRRVQRNALIVPVPASCSDDLMPIIYRETGTPVDVYLSRSRWITSLMERRQRGTQGNASATEGRRPECNEQPA